MNAIVLTNLADQAKAPWLSLIFGESHRDRPTRRALAARCEAGEAPDSAPLASAPGPSFPLRTFSAD